MNMLRASKAENASCEEQAKLIQERLLETEDWLSKMCLAFSLYTKKASRLRDATDEIALILNDFATHERINKSIKLHILSFSDLLASLGDLRDHKIKKLETDVVNHLSQYGVLCRNTKAEVKNIFSAKEKEANKRKQLSKIQSMAPNNRGQIALGIHNRELYDRIKSNMDSVKAEAALSTAVSNVSQSQRELEEHAIFFEKKKIEDIKTILLQFISLELAEYSAAIEILTKSFNEVQSINVKCDLKEFNDVLKINPISQRLLTVKNNSTKDPQFLSNYLQQSSRVKEDMEKTFTMDSETFENTSESSDRNET